MPWRNWFGIFALLIVLLLIIAPALLMHGKTVSVDWNATHQTIDGFGASVTGYTGSFTPAQASMFFSPVNGLGLSLIRIRVIPDTTKQDCQCVANSEPSSCTVGSGSEILSGDLQIAELAASYGVRIFAAPWSPPAKMKSSGKYCTSGAFIGGPSNYREYAASLASFPVLLREHGLSLYAMSVQNEPDIANADYDTCTWTAEQIRGFVPRLSEALQSAGYGNIKIAIPEESTWNFDLMNATMQDKTVSADVALIFGHAYSAEKPSSVPMMGDRHVWQTEVSNFGEFDESMTDALVWAGSIHNYMSVGANAWMYWSLDCGSKYYNKTNNMCLTGRNGKLAKRGYVLAQFAKFVRPGWQRIEVRNDSSMLITAYKGQDKQYALVVINRSELPVVDQKFELVGSTSWGSKVLPWVTSAAASLRPQAAISLTPGATTFEYTIPARSVVTFEGQAN
jgi:glucuronoarabinoxylan endo-1,4-beta-xylanase